MIILNKSEVDVVSGFSIPGHLILPAALQNGKDWVLSEAVLDDPAHASKKEFLSTLPRREVSPDEYVNEDVVKSVSVFRRVLSRLDIRRFF